MSDSNYQKSINYLRSDILKHLSTLKYLTLYQDKATIELLEDGRQGWAVSVEIPTRFLSYDMKVYPKAETAIFINGSSKNLKYELLTALSNKNYILRLNEILDLSIVKDQFEILRGNSFLSYSCSAINDAITDPVIPGNNELTDKAIAIIIKNGYMEAEVKKYFDNGALWFGLTVDNNIKSLCFIYQNYDAIWEIAGVHTIETERHKGYAKIVVASALKYLLDNKLVPRYEADSQNLNSIKLAQSLTLKQFLRIDHFLLNRL